VATEERLKEIVMPLNDLQTVQYMVDDGIATLTLNRPEKMNPYLTIKNFSELGKCLFAAGTR
jgi:enoyl-CoA hydratase/carnithine racemase